MALEQVKLGNVPVSRMLIGGNPFSGFSHQSPERDTEMRTYYTTETIHAALREAESLGIDTFLGRGDGHITEVLKQYWEQGGAIKWVAQTASEAPTQVIAAQFAIDAGCKACYIHGGRMEYMLAQGKEQEILDTIQTIKAAGIPAGVAGHAPYIFAWAEAHLDLDFYMCCYYNPSPRDKQPWHDPTIKEQYLEQDRQLMIEQIKTLSKPVIHYKVLAAGRNDPREGLFFAAKQMRTGDAVCVGFYTKDDPGMIAQDIAWLEEGLLQAAG
ncbi:MAG: hypothetical protein JXA89_09730 [Anaerolineae bacterium]|nr:hypothetical protein [Anaerolineae bacterium]